MSPLGIVFVSIGVVLVGILVFRLHAFVALLLAALTAALITPTENLLRGALRDRAVAFSVDAKAPTVAVLKLKPGDVFPDQLLWIARRDPAAAAGDQRYQRVGVLAVSVEPPQSAGDASRAAPPAARVLGAPRAAADAVALQADDLLVPPGALAAAGKAARATPMARLLAGFGRTCQDIAVLIALASIIGKCLLDSGAADRIVRSALRLVGEQRAPAAFLGSGFLLGIPVFFDTVFYLLIPLGKALRARTGGNYLLYILTIVAGATMTHSLVPPTPGPLLAASALGVDMFTMIVGGLAVGAVASGAGYLFAHWINRRLEIPLRDTADVSLAELERLIRRPDHELPPLGLSLAPILLPVLLIGSDALWRALPASPAWLGWITPLADTVCDKNVAVGLGAAVALATLAWRKGLGLKELAPLTQNCLASAGAVILITAAGGALGHAIQQTGVAEQITGWMTNSSGPWILTLAFGVTVLVRTAQGSATVAMITASSVFAPFAASGALPCHNVYLALAIGCGSKPVAWMADSGFWVICTMSGMRETDGLKTITPMSGLMGVVGFLTTLALAWLLPLK